MSPKKVQGFQKFIKYAASRYTNFKLHHMITWLYPNLIRSTKFQACNAGIATRATILIGIYESDNGRKGE